MVQYEMYPEERKTPLNFYEAVTPKAGGDDAEVASIINFYDLEGFLDFYTTHPTQESRTDLLQRDRFPNRMFLSPLPKVCCTVSGAFHTSQREKYSTFLILTAKNIFYKHLNNVNILIKADNGS